MLSSVWYVNDDAGGASTGLDWDDAFTDLQLALASATAGDEIWVAEGIYQPTSDLDRTKAFTLKTGVHLYGGFEGSETVRDERNWTQFVTTLSGDLGVPGELSDNSYHVIRSPGDWSTSLGNIKLDGFVVTGGNSNGSVSLGYDRGGGMYATVTSMTVSNSIFRDNHADMGGAVFQFYTAPTYTNVVFENNSSIREGGAVETNGWHTHPRFINVAFTGNVAGTTAGGLYNNDDSSPTLIHVTFSGNSAGIRGGAMFTHVGSPSVTNTIAWGNVAPTDGQFTGPANVSYSIVEGGWTGTGNLDSDPQFVDAASGDLHLLPGSPAIDAGAATGAPNFDLDGNPRPYEGDADGLPEFDMGAFEVQNQPPVADLNGPYLGQEGIPLTLDASASYDPNLDPLQYRWDFDDDGTWDTGWLLTPTIEHYWTDDYLGQVTLEISDGVESTTASAAVTVSNVNPRVTSLSVTPDEVDEHDVVALSGTFVDGREGGHATDDTFDLTVDWGDGEVEIFDYPAGADSFSETHRYRDDNPSGTAADDYTITVSLTDDDGPAEFLPEGALLIADSASRSVILVDPATGTQTAISSGGLLLGTEGVLASATGEIYVTNASNGSVVRVDAATGNQSLVSSGGYLTSPRGIVMDAQGSLVVVDAGNHRVIRIDPDDGSQTVVTTGNLMHIPFGAGVEMDGHILATSTFGPNYVVRVDPMTGAQSAVTTGGYFRHPVHMIVDADGSVLVADQSALNDYAGAVIRVDPVTGAQTVVSGHGYFMNPSGVAVDANGEIYVSDYTLRRVIHVNPDTGAQTLLTSDGLLQQPVGIAVIPEQLPPMATVTVSVRNVAPELTDVALNKSLVYSYETVRVAGEFQDPGTLDEHTLTVDWDDGHVETAILPPGVRQFGGELAASHYYAEPGSYEVVVTLQDDDTGSDQHTLQVTVADAPYAMMLGDDLMAFGDSGANRAVVYAGNGPGVVWVRIDGQLFGPFSPTGKIDVAGREGNDYLTVSGSITLPCVLDGGEGDDYLAGAAGDDTLVGGEGNDRMLAGEGDNLLDGGPGDDRLYARSGNDRLYGGPGNDLLYAAEGNDYLNGGEGDDQLSGGLGDDLLRGGPGHDYLDGYYGYDILVGGDGDDELSGGADRDLLIGGSGLDRLRGGYGDDVLVAGWTMHDEQDVALQAILHEWRSIASMPARVDALSDPSFTAPLNADTVFDDGELDWLYGELGDDWLLSGVGDVSR